MARLADRALQGEFLFSFNSHDVTNTAWAFAKLGIHNHALMTGLARRMLQEGFLSTFTDQEVVNTAWAFTKLGVRNEGLRLQLQLQAGKRQKRLRSRMATAGD
uniref:Uncharacterized protein n=1 Tax=Eutreptiella gymnastica TaxID=73025 RepID=A0A7S1J392_9EUGL|mmetsp:Transcript_63443/g.113232  ORF Transcript_63443/g.113232 Transcript_63443/m.113232 type:complete len:103 (+) Transcript_63443:3-311(+)